MKQEAPRHPKMQMLADKLGVPLYSAVGIMELLWNFTGFYAPRGDIGRISDRAIIDAVRWKKKPEVLLSALIACGFLDVSDSHRLIVHDWQDHAQEWVRKRIKRGGQSFITNKDTIEMLSRQEADNSPPRAGLGRIGSGRSGDTENVEILEEGESEQERKMLWSEAQCTAFLKKIKWDARHPNDQMADAILRLDLGCLPETHHDPWTLPWLYSALGLFERIWPEYWLRSDKMAARVAFLKSIERYGLDLADEIEAAIKRQAPTMKKKEPRHRPHMATWLNGERWKDAVDGFENGGVGESAWGLH